MQLLFLTSRLPYPPDRGDRLRAYHFLRNMAADHEITLVTFIASEEERPFLEHLTPYCTNIHVVLWPGQRSVLAVAVNIWRPLPLQALFYRSKAMKKLLDNLIATQKFDAAFIHLFRMAPYLADRHDLYRIVDLTDVISREVELSLPYRPRFWRWLYRLELPRLKRFEQQVATQFDETWLISAVGQKTLLAVAPQANIRVIPNGVEIVKKQEVTAVAPQTNLIFVGHMGVFHNIDAAQFLVEEILPLVREQIPNCCLQLVGAGVGSEVRQLENYPGVAVVGFVPDLAGVLRNSAVFVAPLRFAAGVQNKVLEAMAAAIPVVTTSIGNAGLQAQSEIELLVADDAPTCAAQIVLLLQDAALRQAIGEAGQSFVRQHYSWLGAVNRMRELAEHLTKVGDGGGKL